MCSTHQLTFRRIQSIGSSVRANPRLGQTERLHEMMTAVMAADEFWENTSNKDWTLVSEEKKYI